MFLTFVKCVDVKERILAKLAGKVFHEKPYYMTQTLLGAVPKAKYRLQS